jgi:hypothetical protein
MGALKPVETLATPARRNPMLADTDPTDEELHLVMCEARDVARQRKAVSDAWMHEQLEKAWREARTRDGRHID